MEESNPDEEQPPVEIPQDIEIEGVLSIGSQDGNNKNDFCGFVHRRNYLPGEDDAYVSGQFIKRMGLRRGDYIKGFASPKRGKDRYAPLKRIVSVNGIEVDETDLGRLAAEPVRSQVYERLREIGFTYICADLKGYRTGSMNETLK